MDRKKFNPEEHSISSAGLEVRNAYCLYMRLERGKKNYGQYVIPQYDGGRSLSGRTYKNNVWDKIAQTLNNNQLDIEEYIEFAFHSPSYSDTTPQLLLSPSILDSYRKKIETMKKPTIWEIEEQQIQTDLAWYSSCYKEPLKVIRRTLLGQGSYVTPLVRYSFGCRNSMKFIVDVLEEQAFKQYFRRRFFYERYYAQFIPEHFRERAKICLNSVNS